MKEIRIKNLMTANVRHVGPSTPLSRVIRIMKEHRHSCIVVTKSGIPLGIVTERDIVHRFASLVRRGPAHDPAVSSIMSSPPVTIHERASLFEALVITKSRQIRHLPVTNEEGCLVGIVTYTDLVSAHFRVVETQTELLEREVANRTQKLLEVNRKLRNLSMEDALLEIGNRRAMEVDLRHTHAAAVRYQRPYAVVLLDVDHFKLYNDYYGHAAGDRALQQITVCLKQSIRRSDRLYRYGGEELLVLFPETSRVDAHTVARRLIKEIANRRIPHEHHPLKVVAVSGGLGFSDDAVCNQRWPFVVERADEALYRAKCHGRNRIEPFRLSAGEDCQKQVPGHGSTRTEERRWIA